MVAFANGYMFFLREVYCVSEPSSSYGGSDPACCGREEEGGREDFGMQVLDTHPSTNTIPNLAQRIPVLGTVLVLSG